MNPVLAPPAPVGLILGLPLGLALLALLLRWVRPSALLAGVPFGMVVLWWGGLGGFSILVGFFLLGTALTRFGYAAKAARGVAEEAGGRRGSSHVLANCGAGLLVLAVRALCQELGWFSASSANLERLLWAAYVGSFAAAASDTASSEIGQLLGRHPMSLRTLRPVPVGMQGAVSLEGLVAGLGASLLLGLLGLLFGMLSLPGLLAVTAGGFLGNLLESLAGTWGRRALPHGGLNFANTLIGAVASSTLLAMW